MAQEEETDIPAEDTGGKKKKKKKKKLKRASSGDERASKSAPAISGDTEIEEMLNKIRSMDEDLQNRMERICELCGMTKREVESFIDNPNNFSDHQWAKMQQDKEQLENKIYSEIGIQAKKRVMKKKKKKLAKGRRGKTLGGRKGWIQM